MIAPSRPSSSDSISILPIELAAERVEVVDAGDDRPLAGTQAPPQRVRRQRLVVADAEADADAAALVDLVARPGEVAERGDDLGQVVGHDDLDLTERAADRGRHVERHRLLQHDRHLGRDVERVVRADLAAEAVLQRGDDAAAVGVVLRVGRGEQHHVERQTDLVAADLHVALLEHVEHADLDALGEVGQLVDGEDATVRARHEAVVQGQLVGQVAALGDLDRVDLADQVGDRRVGGGQLLAEALAAVDPVDRRVVAHARRRGRGRASTPGCTGRR